MSRRRKTSYPIRIGQMLGTAAALGSLGLAGWLLHAAVAWYFGGR